MYDAPHGEGGRSKSGRGAGGLRGPGRHGSGKAVGVQARYGARLPIEKELRAYTSPQPPACYGTNLVREERQGMGSEGGGLSAWQVGAAEEGSLVDSVRLSRSKRPAGVLRNTLTCTESGRSGRRSTAARSCTRRFWPIGGGGDS